MRRIIASLILASTVSISTAQQSIDLSTLPTEIKTLKWSAVDVGSLSPVQKCRALLVLNEVLDEMNAQLSVEADLMSEFIDTKGLGPSFASQPPAPEAAPLTMQNGLQIAAAMLAGPLADSSYATQMSDSSDEILKAYDTMYQSTCRGKWHTADASRLQVRAMSRFLQSHARMSDYQAWVPGEMQRRAAEAAKEQAARQAAEAAKNKNQEAAFMQKQAEKISQQSAQLQQQQAAAAQMQRALAAAQQQNSQNAAPQNAPAAAPTEGYPEYYYGGWGAVAAADWYRHPGYAAAAASRTDARMASWHGAGFRRR
ncbi:MAG: hypothetical protein JNK25_01325 [Phycisphaerae bacterium]|nr:hypothetical protein [Phycisphaerae bacterium]